MTEAELLDEARRFGADAYWFGWVTCPHERGTALYDEWWYGWHGAEADDVNYLESLNGRS